ncbi:MAG: DinB family protein, partial [Halioglobus sp.]|nr:DinB family protein [Halioglobus sp.]
MSSGSCQPDCNPSLASLADRFDAVRRYSVAICEPLTVEDYALQREAFVSPPKWHLAHTSWFFETFLLKPFLHDYQTPNEHYEQLFNSYYNGVGEQFPRPQRGLLSRPTVAEVLDYRAAVEEGMRRLLATGDHPSRDAIAQRTELGIEHEKQHQELYFTDLKYSLEINPLAPVLWPRLQSTGGATPALDWQHFDGGLVTVGCTGEGFCFDNELPPHQYFLQPFSLADRLVSNAEFLQFVISGGYQQPQWWLADGWALVQAEGWTAPLYWRRAGTGFTEFTLHGPQPLAPDL